MIVTTEGAVYSWGLGSSGCLGLGEAGARDHALPMRLHEEDIEAFGAVLEVANRVVCPNPNPDPNWRLRLGSIKAISPWG